MTDALAIMVAGVVGLGLGALFFGGLWWTLRKALSSRQPALWFLGSLLVRTSGTLLGFYLVAGGHWERFVSCLMGFIIARTVVTWSTRAPREVRDAP